MANHERKIEADFYNILLGIKRTKDGEKAECIRAVEKNPEDLEVFKFRCKLLGGIWRIYRTVNLRDTEKARLYVIHQLIDFPEKRGYVDSVWRTGLLQKSSIYGENKWLLDIDTEDSSSLCELEKCLKKAKVEIVKVIKTPKGYHYIVKPFDAREIYQLKFVSLLRDGYVFVEKIGE